MLKAMDVVNNDIYTSINSIINSTKFISYGIIDEVVSDTVVNVVDASKSLGEEERMSCTYLSFASAEVSVKHKPKVGDLVLILSLQNKHQDLFTAKEAIEMYPFTGYTKRSCVALPVGLHIEDSSVIVEVNEGKVSLTMKELSVVSEKSSLQLGDTTVDASDLVINSGAQGVARMNDSIMSSMADDTAFFTWVTTISTVVNGLAPGSVPPPFPSSLSGKITSGSSSVKIGD